MCHFFCEGAAFFAVGAGHLFFCGGRVCFFAVEFRRVLLLWRPGMFSCRSRALSLCLAVRAGRISVGVKGMTSFVAEEGASFCSGCQAKGKAKQNEALLFEDVYISILVS